MSKPMEDVRQAAELSLVMPCYNEEQCLELTVPPLVDTFTAAGVSLEIVLVDNGSTDRTSEVIERLIRRGLPVKKGVVRVNRGQGLGILTGLKLASGRYVGYLCADGQVSPDSVLAIYRALKAGNGQMLAKARRRFRRDSWRRKLVSIAYNGLMLALFPGMPSLDVNGNPKIFPAELLAVLDLQSTDWFLEAELMLKARHLRVLVIEIDVPGYLRKGGKSHVRLATIFEFARNILVYRFGGPWRNWRRQAPVTEVHEASAN